MGAVRVVLPVLIALNFATASPTWSQPAIDFGGRVFDADSKRGVENLEVKLIPPKQSRLPIRVASTDQNGAFLFRQLARGRYLLEVSQGVHLLYRAEVDVNQQDRIDIPLQRRR
jgi:hypothetical protein